MAPPSACPTGLGIGAPYELFAMPVNRGRGKSCDPAGNEAKVVIPPKVLKMNRQQSFHAQFYA